MARFNMCLDQDAASSKHSHHSQTKSTDSVTKQGNTSNPALKDLQENFKVQNGVSTMFVPKDSIDVVVEHTNTTEPIVHSPNHTQAQTPNVGTWSSIVARNVPVTEARSNELAQIIFNEDGSATLKPPKNFLLNARKSYKTSPIGHFIGGNFDFRFVRDQAFRLWKNKGLFRVFYSSKGYFTFKFTTVKEKDEVLSLNSVQMGGKTLYLMPWMEANKFKKNVIESVPCWVKMEDVPNSYWSSEGLTHIAKAVGLSLKFDENTARFEPLRFAMVQVMLSYSSPRPDFI